MAHAHLSHVLQRQWAACAGEKVCGGVLGLGEGGDQRDVQLCALTLSCVTCRGGFGPAPAQMRARSVRVL